MITDFKQKSRSEIFIFLKKISQIHTCFLLSSFEWIGNIITNTIYILDSLFSIKTLDILHTQDEMQCFVYVTAFNLFRMPTWVLTFLFHLGWLFFLKEFM